MTARVFKQKTPTIRAIEVTSLLEQASEVANLIGSQAYQVDVAKAEATFVLVGQASLTAKEGQVVSILNDVAAVSDAKDFYSLYEPA